MIDTETFRLIVDTYKAKKGVRSDAEICRATGISTATFSQYRRCPQRMSVATMSRICGYLGINREDRGILLE